MLGTTENGVKVQFWVDVTRAWQLADSAFSEGSQALVTISSTIRLTLNTFAEDQISNRDSSAIYIGACTLVDFLSFHGFYENYISKPF